MKFDKDLCLNFYMSWTSYFGKLNSTPGSVVPLTMFMINIIVITTIKPLVETVFTKSFVEGLSRWPLAMYALITIISTNSNQFFLPPVYIEFPRKYGKALHKIRWPYLASSPHFDTFEELPLQLKKLL